MSVRAVRLVAVSHLNLRCLTKQLNPAGASENGSRGAGMQRFYLFIPLYNGLPASLCSHPNGHIVAVATARCSSEQR